MKKIENHSWYYGPVVQEGQDEGISWQPEEYVAQEEREEAKHNVLTNFGFGNVVQRTTDIREKVHI